jgi:hypothetical protein
MRRMKLTTQQEIHDAANIAWYHGQFASFINKFNHLRSLYPNPDGYVIACMAFFAHHAERTNDITSDNFKDLHIDLPE